MVSIFNTNGLVVWTEQDIQFREFCTTYISSVIKESLLTENNAWKFYRIESSLLTPNALINPEYSDSQVYKTSDNLTLRPETTAGSYQYAIHLMDSKLNLAPLVVYQSGKSFRQEQDQVTSNVRLKEFYQLEYQCIYSTSTKNDYMTSIIESLVPIVSRLTNKEVRVVVSDRLPNYSLKTIDIEVKTNAKWLEVCSISKRTDFPAKLKFGSKSGVVESDAEVLEIAFGLDRLIYCHKE
jgi:glycyl-tRNA synthetase